jgi:uncharacterized repeat protein (TIGR01451 family)
MFKPQSLRQTSALWALMGLLMWQAVPASAQHAPATEPRLASQLVMSLVVLDGLMEKLTPTSTVQPGDLLQYTTHFGNPTAAAMRDVVSSLPVPAGTQWVPGSERPGAVTVSVDGIHYGAMPLMRKQLQANGQWLQVPVPMAEIRYLRWPARNLAASESFATSLRVRVLSGDAVNASLAPATPSDTRSPQVAAR